MTIVNFQGIIPSNKPAKRMLEVRKEGKNWIVHINYSSLELIQTCLKKAYYNLDQNWIGAETEALCFGTAAHKGLQVWYVQPRKQRTRISPVCMDYQIDPSASVNHAEICARCASIDAFRIAAHPLRMLPPDNKRSIENGIEVLNGYFDEYLNDPYEVIRLENGDKLVEYNAQALMHQGWRLKIFYHGALDLGLKNIVTGEQFITDHKTTTQLGKDFYNRIKPNHQYTGYVWLAQKDLHIDTNQFLVNGLQVAKTRRALARQFTERNQEDFDELRDAVVHNVERYLSAQDSGTFPQNAPNPCTMYGGCGYRGVCDLPQGMREQNLKMNYQRRGNV